MAPWWLFAAQPWWGKNGMGDRASLRHHCRLMTDVQPNIHDIIAELEILTNKLKCATDENQRRIFLRQFRELLDGADKLAAKYYPTERRDDVTNARIFPSG